MAIAAASLERIILIGFESVAEAEYSDWELFAPAMDKTAATS